MIFTELCHCFLLFHLARSLNCYLSLCQKSVTFQEGKKEKKTEKKEQPKKEKKEAPPADDGDLELEEKPKESKDPFDSMPKG